MNLTITLSSEMESRLKSEAARLGIDAAEYAHRLIAQALSPAPAVVEVVRSRSTSALGREGTLVSRLKADAPNAGRGSPADAPPCNRRRLR